MTAVSSSTLSQRSTSRRRGLNRDAFRLQNAGVVYALIVLVTVFAVAAAVTNRPPYLSAINTANILDQTAPIAIVAVFQTLVLISGNFDLSVGSNAALSGAFAISVFNHSSLSLGIASAIGLGVLIGVLNALLVEFVGVNSFIVTLGALTGLRGVLLIATNGQSVQTKHDQLSTLVSGAYAIDARWLAAGCAAVLVVAGIYPRRPLFALPRAVLILTGVTFAILGWLFLPASWPLTKQSYLVVAVTAITWAVLRFTVVGRRLYAVGGNTEAAQLSGISVRWYKVVPFALTGFGAAIVGVLYAGQFGAVSPNSLSGFELTVIAAAILGGTSLFGGAGSVVNSVLGALILVVLSNGFAVLNLGANYQPLIQGIVIIAAAATFAIAERRAGQASGARTARTGVASATDEVQSE